MIRDHIRSTDRHPVGKLSIVTQYNPSKDNTFIIGEERVLRDQPTEDINTNIVVLENPATGQKSYLSITRSQAVNLDRSYFQLRAYQPQPK